MLAMLGDTKDDGPRESRYRAALFLLYGCGLRLSEVATLLDRDVDTRERVLRVLGKGAKERVLPIPERCIPVIEAYQKQRMTRPDSPTSSPAVIAAARFPCEHLHAMFHSVPDAHWGGT